MNALAQRVILLSGWARLLLAFAAGAVGALAMPPFGIVPALAVPLTAAVWLIDGSAGDGGRLRLLPTLASAALAGFAWGFGYFVAGLWWLGAAFLVEAEEFAWALPLGVLGLPAVLALFPALGFAVARLLWPAGPRRLFALALGLGLSEWLRGTLFTGFPWNTLGMAFGQHLWLMQGASLVGLDGLSVLAVLIGAAPAVLGTETTPSARLTAPVLALFALAGLAAYGAWRVPAGPVPSVAGVKLRLVQPNIPQDRKFSYAAGPEILRRYIALSDRASSPQVSGVGDVTHLIWPESAFPFLLHQEPWALNRIAAFLPPGVTLVTGAARESERLSGEPGRRFFNAIQVIGDDGSILGSYDKTHLVPFGEYLPHALDGVLRGFGLRQFVHVPGGFEESGHRGTLAVRGLPPVAATICYEAIFSGAILGGGARPGLILNVTNDAWFGRTPGPYQHFAQARLRAVEEGLPLVRDANSGISAVVDPYGRIVASLPLGVEGTVDATLPASLPAPTFSQLGRILFIVLLLMCAAAAWSAGRLPRPSRQTVQEISP